ncbi:MAG: ATP-dependent DNA helicase RecG, partial [Candidatus Kryptoniota bacterium]
MKRPLAKTEVKYIKGVGPKRAEALATVGVSSALDLLYYFPRKYLDRSRIFKIKDARSALLVPDEVTFVGRIKLMQIAGRGKRFLFIKLSDETGT